MKTKIINVLPHIPDYAYLKDEPRPAVNWDTPSGNWVGIYRNEIPNKLGREVLKFTDEFEYEVWQPDLRADKIYSHRFEDGLVHRLFPAERKNELHGLKIRKTLYSPALTQHLLYYGAQHKVVVNLNGDFERISYEILEKCGHLPILQTFRGTMNLPESRLFKRRWNVFATFKYLYLHQKTKKLIKKVDYVTYQNNLHLNTLDHIYQGPRAKITSGCDFSFWHKLDKNTCRKALGLPESKSIFLTSSLLIKRKQVDKLLKVLKDLDEKDFNFLLLVSGHGNKEYEKYLENIARPLIKKGKVRFIGYITGETLKQYYSASDLFINPSLSEGGPVSAMKALACETPVFSTKIGNVAERMQLNNSGILVDIKDYRQWKNSLVNFLSGKEIKPFDREEAERFYDWQQVAKGFAKIYRQLEGQNESLRKRDVAAKKKQEKLYQEMNPF